MKIGSEMHTELDISFIIWLHTTLKLSIISLLLHTTP
jgi:hypothetical protein